MDCRNVRFCDRKADVDFTQLVALFARSAFWASERSAEDIKIAVENSDPVITAWDGDRTIGFARATSDGIFRATIWDVVIHSDYQGLGLGRKLVETLLGHPKMNRVERVYLMTTNQRKFYERIGFVKNTTTTMLLEQSPLEIDVAALADERALSAAVDC
ncbi:MAG: GNAT family N-acetyltransferase [Geitlerinemataceae cyanobacterium]